MGGGGGEPIKCFFHLSEPHFILLDIERNVLFFVYFRRIQNSDEILSSLGLNFYVRLSLISISILEFRILSSVSILFFYLRRNQLSSEFRQNFEINRNFNSGFVFGIGISGLISISELEVRFSLQNFDSAIEILSLELDFDINVEISKHFLTK
jgi:hypothetical protein